MVMETLFPFEKIQRKILVKKHAETSPKFGGDPEKRSTEELLQYGIVNIDKPRGPTSHQVSAYAKKILGVSKAGHSGTLDPHVTGVLPVAICAATKVVQALLTAGKEYICLMHLHGDYAEEKIRAVCASFVGNIKQLPPLKSAVRRQERWRKIYYLEILEIDGRDVLFRVGCQAGTYIRTLCVEIGKLLGSNAHMQELRRTKVGLFQESTICPLQDLTDAFWYYKNEKNDTLLRKYLQPMERGVAHLPKIWVFDTTVDTLCHGASLKVPGMSKFESEINEGDFVAIMTLKNELIGMGKANMNAQDLLKNDKGIAATLQRVVMAPGTYPRCASVTKSI